MSGEKSERILTRLFAGRARFNTWNWETRKSFEDDEYLNALRLVLGSPEDTTGNALEYLVCGTPQPARKARDLDSWFCSSCCPVCR
jgi:hypothetical protein